MVQWDKDSCSDAGFLKIDLLGLGMLSAVERCVEHIAARRGERDRPLADPLRRPGDLRVHPERRHHRRLPDREPRADGSLRRTRPGDARRPHDPGGDRAPGADLRAARSTRTSSAASALRVDPDFEVPYEHPSLEPVLRDTLGTIIFQDQVIEVAMAFAGFSPGEAEGLRRAMSRKRSEAAIEAYHERFVEGAMARYDDVDAATAERVWTMIVGFSGFGFPKAHGAAFGLLAYQSTWLRVHYGAGVPVRAARRAADGLLSARRARPRGAAARDRGAAARRQRQRGRLHGRRPRARCGIGLGYVLGVRARRGRGARRRARGAAGRSARSTTSPSRAGAGRPALERLAWSGACDAAAAGRAARARRCGSSASRRRRVRRRAGHAARAAARPARARRRCARSSGWEAMIADYATTA